MTCAARRTWTGCGRRGAAGRLLITTADPATVSGEPRVLAIAVPAFSTREALGYLSARLTTDPDQRSGAIDLAAELGCEPAALAQAGAVIASSGMPCREYRHYFVQRRAQLAAADGAPPSAGGGHLDAVRGHAGQLAPGAGHLAAAGAGRGS